MSENSTSQSTTLSTLLGQDGLNAARRFYKNKQTNKPGISDIAQIRAFLPSLIDFHSRELSLFSETYLKYLLTVRERKALKAKLKFTFYLLYSQLQLDLAEHNNTRIASLGQRMEKCQDLIWKLRSEKGQIKAADQTIDAFSPEDTPESLLEDATQQSSKPLRFWGMQIGGFIGRLMMAIIDDKTIAEMSSWNELRLYWVWGGGMLTSLLQMLPNDFFNNQQAQNALRMPQPITGYMSWVLYYARLGLNLYLLMDYANPWMDANSELGKVPWQDRWQTQWQMRKFSILNDVFWATANLACYFWLTGPGKLGAAGNIVTATLLAMDLVLTCMRYQETITARKKQFAEYEKSIADLIKQRTAQEEHLLYIKLSDSPEEKIKIAEINDKIMQDISNIKFKISDIEKLKKKELFNAKFERFGLYNDLAYAAGLLGAFCLMCCFFAPVAAPVAMVLGLTGAVLSFVFTVASSAIRSGLEIEKSKQTRQEIKKQCASLLRDFGSITDDNKKRLIYLEIAGLMTESDYQKKLIHFQALKLIRSVFIDAFVPVIIFASLVFMPMGIGLGVMGAGLALALLSNVLIKRLEPEAESLPEFNEQKFEGFCSAYESDPKTCLKHFSAPKNNNNFFKEAPVPVEDYQPVRQEDEGIDAFPSNN